MVMWDWDVVIMMWFIMIFIVIIRRQILGKRCKLLERIRSQIFIMEILAMGRLSL